MSATRIRCKRIVMGATVVAALGFAVTGCGGLTGDNSAEVAKKAGATSCTASDYELINRLDGSHRRIYDCLINGRLRCVTYEGGIAKDETAAAKLLFADQLNKEDAPDCVT